MKELEILEREFDALATLWSNLLLHQATKLEAIEEYLQTGITSSPQVCRQRAAVKLNAVLSADSAKMPGQTKVAQMVQQFVAGAGATDQDAPPDGSVVRLFPDEDP